MKMHGSFLMETLDFFPFDVKRREICFGQLLIDPDWPFSRMTNFEKLQKKNSKIPPLGKKFKKNSPKGGLFGNFRNFFKICHTVER